MAKRKKHLRLPSGYGQIRYLGKGRRNCYAVHPPAVADPEAGAFVRQKALCYVDDWYVGFAVLASYHNGTYKPGDELAMTRPSNKDKADSACTSILSLIQAQMMDESAEEEPKGKTFAEVYEAYFEWKFGAHAPKALSASSKTTTQAAYRNLAPLHDLPFADIRVDDMQRVLDGCPLKKASIELMVSLLHQLYKYADARELCEKDYSRFLVVPNAEDDEHGVPFTESQLETFWRDQDNPVVEMLLIMCYSGFRIKAYRSMEINLDEMYFRGGVKTKSSKGRIVPIHSAIIPLVQRRLAREGKLLPQGDMKYRNELHSLMGKYGFEDHTPHDCRHTFSSLCERYGVSENDRKRMLGHSFRGDVTNSVYGHRSLDDLREEIEKIKAPCGL